MSEFEMPEASLGDIVLFYPHEGADPNMAFVSGVSKRTLTLWVLAPGYGGSERPSVHHLTDPGVNEFPDWKAYGYWAHRPEPKLSILSEKVSLLEKIVKKPK